MSIAVATTVFNERVFLPLWLRHYGEAFGRSNVYVVDDGSDDGSTDALPGLNLLKHPKEPLDEYRRAAQISSLHTSLLQRHGAALFTDADEFIVVDPRVGKTLAQYIEEDVDGYATPLGFEVLYNAFAEPLLDFSIPLFRQRSYVYHDQSYSKTLISKVPIVWQRGFHQSNLKKRHDPNLFLFHLRSADPRIAAARLRNYNRVERSAKAIAKGHGAHFTLDAETFLPRLFPQTEAPFLASLAPADFDGMVASIVHRERTTGPWPCKRLDEQFLELPDRFDDVIQLAANA